MAARCLPSEPAPVSDDAAICAAAALMTDTRVASADCRLAMICIANCRSSRSWSSCACCSARDAEKTAPSTAAITTTTNTTDPMAADRLCLGFRRCHSESSFMDECPCPHAQEYRRAPAGRK